jgi:heat shock 70kDa protein 4
VLNDKLNDAESWLYGDGFDEAKAVYQMKLDELKSLGDPIVRREYEFSYRSEAAKAVGQQVEFFRKIALSSVGHESFVVCPPLISDHLPWM